MDFILSSLLELTTAWKGLAQSKAAVSVLLSDSVWQPFRENNCMKYILQYLIVMMMMMNLFFKLAWHTVSDVYFLCVVAAHRKPSRSSSRYRGYAGFSHGPPKGQIVQDSPLQGWENNKINKAAFCQMHCAFTTIYIILFVIRWPTSWWQWRVFKAKGA